MASERGEPVRPSQKPRPLLVETHPDLFPSSAFETRNVSVAPEDPRPGDPAPQNFPPDPAQQDLVPAAFVPPDPRDHFTPDDLATLKSLRQEFAEALEAGRLRPEDPRYLQRWKELEAALEERYRAQFGDEAYVKYQGEASRMQAPQ